MSTLTHRPRSIVALVGLTVLISLIAGCQNAIQITQPTHTPQPTWTRTARPVTPTAAASPTRSATSTPTLDASIQTTFAADVNPLTGEKVADPGALNRRPLAIKVSNYPPQVRPQRGLTGRLGV